MLIWLRCNELPLITSTVQPQFLCWGKMRGLQAHERCTIKHEKQNFTTHGHMLSPFLRVAGQSTRCSICCSAKAPPEWVRNGMKRARRRVPLGFRPSSPRGMDHTSQVPLQRILEVCFKPSKPIVTNFTFVHTKVLCSLKGLVT
jgi:hypothetical protein